MSRDVLATDRLRLRELDERRDAAFVLELLTDPSFLRHIGDRGVRDLASARDYIRNGPRASYAQHGFGLWMVEARASGEALGLCGLLQRDSLPAPDIGYAFLPRHWSRGYAREACAAVRDHALGALKLPRLLAIVAPDNAASIRVLEHLGLRFERTFVNEAGEALHLYALDAAAAPRG